jgi:hypothetical protein
MLLFKQSRGDPFEAIHQARNGDFGRVVHQKVDMVLLAIALNEPGLKIQTDTGKNLTQVLQEGSRENVLTVFSNKDQMDM